MRKGARLLLAAADKASSKTLGILLGLSLGASASGLFFLPASSPPAIEQEIEAGGFPHSDRAPSSANHARYSAAGNRPAQGRPSFAPYDPSSSAQSFIDSSAQYAADANPELLPDPIEIPIGSASGSSGSSLDQLEGAMPTSSAGEGSAKSDTSGTAAGAGAFVGGIAAADTSETESTETSTSTYTKSLSLGSLASSAYSGESLAATYAVEMLRSDTSARDTSWADQLSVAAYTDSACSSAATGTASASSLTMTLGSSTLTNIVYTAASAGTEETIYLKITAATAGVSACSSAVYVKQRFNAGTGSVLFQHGGNGASGNVPWNKSDIPIDSALDSQNRIVIAGMSLNTAGRHELALWRFLPDGSLDTSFGGGNGYLTFQPGGNGAAGAVNASKQDNPGGSHSLVIDSQGRILIAGSSRNAAGSYEATLWRFEEDGDLDTTFGGTGYVTFQPGGNGAAGAVNASKYDEGRAVSIDSTGRYLLAGNSRNALGGSGPVLIRYLSDGSVDTSFGTAGVVVLGDGTGGFGGKTNTTKDDWAVLATSLAGGGYLLAGGSNTSAGSTVSVLWQVTAAGAFDTTFGGGDGWMQMNEGAANALGAAFASRDDGVNDLNVSSSGLITVLMYANTAGGFYEVTLTRLDSDGSVDTSFGTAGSTSVLAGGRSLAGTDPAKKFETASRLLTDSSSRLVITATAFNDTWGAEPVMVRLDSSGALDTSFSGDGVYTYAENDAAGPGGASAVQKRDGQIYPTIDGTVTNFMSQIPLLIDSAGRYVMPFAASVTTYPAAELSIIRLNTDGTIDQ